MIDIELLKYPIGRYNAPDAISMSQIRKWIEEIQALPEEISAAVENLNEAQLSTPYRPNGWNIRQVVHHVADSHINSYIRYHWTLTEDQPTIKAYNQDDWANTADAIKAPVSLSTDILKAIHPRWVFLMKEMSENDFRQKFTHPETGKLLGLDYMTGLYAWHGKHHTAQIVGLRERMEW